MNETSAFTPRPWQASIPGEWIDYNGHLRDAYYTLLASSAVDDLMEQVGLDRAYRAATGGSMFTLEMHVHYLREVKGTDAVQVLLRPLAVDGKRLQVRAEVRTPGVDAPAAVVEMLLLHVQQYPTARATPFPESVGARLRSWLAASAAPVDAWGSRTISLTRPGGAA